MATQSALPVPDAPARLEVIDAADQRVVRVKGHEIACYRRDDRASERVVATQLAETLPMDACDIASTFGMHAVTLSRYRRQVREGGGRALMPRKTGPKGPTKVTPHLIGRIEKLRDEGLSYRAIAARLKARGTEISHVTVAAVLRPMEAEPQELPFETSAAASAPCVAEAAPVVVATPSLEEPETTPIRLW